MEKIDIYFFSLGKFWRNFSTFYFGTINAVNLELGKKPYTKK